MKQFLSLAFLLIAAASSVAAEAGGQEIRACKFEVKARCASGEARVTLEGGAVQRVEVDAFWCGLPGNPGYDCAIDWSRNQPGSRWSQDGPATLVTNASPIHPNQSDSLRVTLGRFVSIDLDGAQSIEHCGAGAELPRAIVIPAKPGKCRVWLSEP